MPAADAAVPAVPADEPVNLFSDRIEGEIPHPRPFVHRVSLFIRNGDTILEHSEDTEQRQKTAETLVREGRYAEAAGLYRELVQLHPGDDSFCLKLAWAYHDDGRIEEAVGCFEELFERELTRKVFTGFAFDELVRIFKLQGRHDRLLAVCERAAAAQRNDYALLGDLGDAYLRAGKAEQAAGVFREMIAMEPESSVLYCSLGEALATMGDEAGAEEAYEQAAAIEPEKAAAYYCRLADHYRKAGCADRARKAIEKSLAPPCGACLLFHAWRYSHRGRQG